MDEDFDIFLFDSDNFEEFSCSDTSLNNGTQVINTTSESDRSFTSAIPKNYFKCSYCFKIFEDEKTLHRHMVQHTSKKYRCEECDKEYVTPSGLWLHVNSTHVRARQYRCRACDKSFHQKAHLKEHMRVHTAEKQHVCSVCDQAFMSKVNLRRHMVSHTGERPFVCAACSKPFAVQPDLERHIRRLHSSLDALCDVCGLRLPATQDLQKHFERHHSGQYSCEHCPVSFARFDGYHAHIHKHFHTPEKHYPLDECTSVCNPVLRLPTLQSNVVKLVRSRCEPEKRKDVEKRSEVLKE